MAIRTANNQSLTEITALPTVAALTDGNLTLLETQTASSDGTLDFTSGIDSTYDSYVFKLINLHGSADSYQGLFQGSIDSGSNYNVAITSTLFYANHYEDDSSTSLAYNAGGDLAQGTGFQRLIFGSGDNASKSGSGELTIFNPSSTTFVKHFLANISSRSDLDSSGSTPGYNVFVGGYFNTTSAIDAVQFKMSTGNIDAGVIKLYGIGPKQ